MKKQLVKSLVAAASVAALSLGMIPGGIAERLGIVTESRAAEYSISKVDGIDPDRTHKENYDVLMELTNKLGSSQAWSYVGGEIKIPENVEQAFQKAIDENKVGEGHVGESSDGKGSLYIAGYYLRDDLYDPSFPDDKYVDFYVIYYSPIPNPKINAKCISVGYSPDPNGDYYDVSGTGFLRPSAGETLTYYLFSTNNATPSTQPTTSNTTASGDNHQHAYDWKILTDPTIDQDGVYAYMCSCGDIKEK